MANKYTQVIEKFLAMKKPTAKTLATIKALLDITSDAYYNSSKSLVTDELWDKCLIHYEKFQKYGSGVTPKQGKKLVEVGHQFPELVGTLSKTNSVLNKEKSDPEQTSIEEWIKSRGKQKDYRMAVTIKVDGNSVTGCFNDKQELEVILTRGKDGLGADLTSVFRNVKIKPPVKVPKGQMLGVKYEAVVLDKDFEAAQEAIGKTFANARSMTAGILNSDDGYKYAEFITLVPLRLQFTKKEMNREEELEIIEKLDKDYAFPIFIIEPITVKDLILEIRRIYKKFNDGLRAEMNFPVDGLVIEFLDSEVREHLGRDDDRNNFDVALKFPYMVKPSKVIDIKFYAGKTGRFTPVVVFEPVIFNGAKCENVSIANYKRFKELNLRKGSPVLIEYRNDVLSYLTLDPSRPVPKTKPIEFIKNCPECGSELELNEKETFVNCRNSECGINMVGKVVNWFTKLNIKGVKENTVEDLAESGLVTKIADLYSLKYQDIMKLDGYKETSAKNIIKAINSRKEMFDWEFFGSLGIEGVGRKTFKLIATKYDLLELDFSKKSTVNELCDIDGINIKTATAIKKFYDNNKELIKELTTKCGLTINSFHKQMANNSSSVAPMNIVFTGFRDADMTSKLESKGHSIKGSVSKNTNMLVVKSKGSGSSKETKAVELGIPIYSLDEFKSQVLNTLI